MRQLFCVICAVVLLLSMCACNNNASQIIKPVNFYYQTDPSNYHAKAITPEVRESDGYSNDLKGLLQQYVNGPVSDGFLNPFPKNVSVLSVEVTNTTVALQLNSRFAQLGETDMTLACACLTETVLEITQRHRLVITSVDAFGNIIYTTSMTRDHILLSDT